MTPDKMAQFQAYNMASRTLAKTRQVVMLYDGAIRFLQQAIEAIKEKRIEDKYNLLVKTSDIIIGLQGCIDFEKGGDVAPVLFEFYSSIDTRILSIHHTNNIETCEKIIAELKEMRDTWDQIDRELVNNQASLKPEVSANAVDSAMNAPSPDSTNVALSA